MFECDREILPAARSAQPRDQHAHPAHYSQGNGWRFRRIGTTTLRVQRKSDYSNQNQE
jgi:hypothetical protein